MMFFQIFKLENRWKSPKIHPIQNCLFTVPGDTQTDWVPNYEYQPQVPVFMAMVK